MAILAQATIVLTGWLDNVKDFGDWTAVKVSVDQRRKNAAGEWETVDKTVYDVSVSGSFSIADNVKRVTVVGRISGTAIYDKRDGSKGVSIKVRAESIEEARDNDAPAKPKDTIQTPSGWEEIPLDPNLPF